MKKKIILSFILISLLITYIFPILSFGNYTNYVALGDSISMGYALENVKEDNYTEKLRQQLNISKNNYQNLSVSGYTAKELYNVIQTDNFTSAIKNADLLTITIGSNEIIELLSEALSYSTGLPNTMDELFLPTVYNYFMDANLSEKIEILLAFYEYITTEDIKGKLETNIARYEEYWKKCIEYIKEINPNATIVATEFYNPYYGVSLLNYDIGGWCDEIIQKLNTILYECSDSEKIYEIAKIYSTFNSTSPRLTNVNISLINLNIDPHPNALGHELISLKILEELTTRPSSQTKIDISTLAITDIEDQEYTGSAIEPSITIKNENSKLVEGKDYNIIYYNNVEVGQASAIILGAGNYTGKTTKTFNINNSNIKDISTCKINAIEYQLYLGMNLEPEVIIQDDTKVLEKNKDYTLKYNNNVNVGMATVTITGIGNYKGFTTTNFIIAPLPLTLTKVHDISDQLYTGKEITPEVIVSFGAIKLLENIDYTLNYENNINKGTATITITGKGNYSGTVTKDFNIINTTDTIEPQLQNISNATISKLPEKTYTGSFITPDIKVTLNGKTLEMNTDYKAFYSNNINVGTGFVTVVGIGDYTGTVETTFKIITKSIENLGLSDISDQEYTGKAIKPQIVLNDGSTKLKENVDYTVSYFNNIEKGVATIQVNGKGNYTDSIFKTFNIVEPKPKPPAENKPVEDKNEPNDNNDNIQSIPGENIDNSASSNSPSDDTTSNSKIPHAGTNLIYLILILSFVGISIIFYKLYRKRY